MRPDPLGLTCLALSLLVGCSGDDPQSSLSNATATDPSNPTITSVSGTTAPADSDTDASPTTSGATQSTDSDAGETGSGCDDQNPCADNLVCCAGACIDVLADVEHCGGCDGVCPVAPNSVASCVVGTCGTEACEPGFTNCDGDAANGCEVSGSCECAPGEKTACYTGLPGTQDVGVCVGGLQTCDAEGTGFGPCEGEVLPGEIDICANASDDDCDGQIDEDVDEDGDGWTVCGGDCCDSVGPQCSTPEFVNPGAFEVMGNKVDDDCDAQIDNVVAACDDGLASNSADPLEYAKAIDLCQFTTEDAPLLEKKWGVISGALTRSDGQGAPSIAARSIRDGFGSVIKPEANMRLAILSTGTAADPGDINPGHAPFQGGIDLDTDASVPADWLAANANNFPNVAGCPEPQGGNTGRDTIQLKLRIRVPTNALSFNAKIYFFSSEYPEWVCSAYNDFFLSLVDSTGAGNPGDKNIAVYKDGNNNLFPVGVNLVKTANGLFTQCKNGPIGCGNGAVAGNYAGCVANNELAGTGFHLLNPAPQFAGDVGYCTAANNQVGGGTGWLKMSGNVKPGETMELRFVIWDTGDEWYDSVVLLDDFQWSVQASQPGVTPG